VADGEVVMKPEPAGAGARRLRRLALSFVGLLLAGIFCLSQADAQLGITGVGGGGFGGSGGGASISALTAASTTGVLGCPATLASGVTFTAGVVVVGFLGNIAAGPIAPTGFTINGVSATQIGSNITDPSQTVVQMWYAVVGSGSGSIVATCGASSRGVGTPTHCAYPLITMRALGASPFQVVNRPAAVYAESYCGET
jgi:hypothetical protein